MEPEILSQWVAAMLTLGILKNKRCPGSVNLAQWSSIIWNRTVIMNDKNKKFTFSRRLSKKKVGSLSLGITSISTKGG